MPALMGIRPLVIGIPPGFSEQSSLEKSASIPKNYSHLAESGGHHIGANFYIVRRQDL
jgi:hypothetical protein